MTETEVPTLLILEADILIRHPLAQYLRECGYRVIEAPGPEEARRMLETPDVRVDVLFASLAGADDRAVFELATWARGAHPDLDVELAGAVDTAIRKAGELCQEEPLKKPYDHQLVLRRVRQLLAARARRRQEDDRRPGD